MLQKFLLALIALMFGTIALPGTASAQRPVVLQPSSAWNLDFADDKCRLARAFGEGKARHVLFFEQHGPSSSFGLTIAGNELENFKSRRKVTIQFGSELPEVSIEPFFGDLGEFGKALIMSSMWLKQTSDSDTAETEKSIGSSGMASIDLTEAIQVEQVSVGQSDHSFVLNTGNMKDPIDALNTCSKDLVRHWGLNMEKHRTITKMPEWTNQKLIARRIISKYPSKAILAGEQGILRMRVIVGEDGSIEDCYLGEATAMESLKSSACREMKKAEFTPAMGSDGKPMRSYYLTSIVYTLD